jgi:tRNA-dihydrouridine synthase B
MLKIGNLIINSRVILAPMSGVTDGPFRFFVKKFAPNCLTFSEMIASDATIRDIKHTMQRCSINESEKDTIGVQLAGYDPQIMAEAAKIVESKGAKIIDINFGCPVKKIVNNYSGSALMKDEDRVKRIINAVVNAVNVPVTIKTRMGWDYSNLNAINIARIAEEEGAQMVTIHGRTRSQMFNGNANWNFVESIKNGVKIPVIVNGDIKTYDNALEALNASKSDGVMMGRGSYGKPWLIGQIDHFLKTGEKLPDPDENTKKQLIFDHCEKIIQYYGDKVGSGFLKKHLTWYSHGNEGASSFRGRINMLDSSTEIMKIMNEFLSDKNEKISVVC